MGSSEAFERMFEEELAKDKISAEKDVLSKLVEEAPRQPLLQHSESARVPVPIPQVTTEPKPSRPQPRRGRKRGQRVI